MNTTEQILLIILAAALAVFLTLAIIVTVQTIKLVKTLRSIAERAQELVDSAESTAEMFKSAVGKLSVLRFAQSVFEMVSKHKK